MWRHSCQGQGDAAVAASEAPRRNRPSAVSAVGTSGGDSGVGKGEGGGVGEGGRATAPGGATWAEPLQGTAQGGTCAAVKQSKLGLRTRRCCQAAPERPLRLQTEPYGARAQPERTAGEPRYG